MTPLFARSARRLLGVAVLMLGAGLSLRAAELSDAAAQELAEQNRRLQQQVQDQQRTIDDLTAKMAAVLKASERHERELQSLQDNVANIATPAATPTYQRDREVRISGEMEAGVFSTGPNGAYPKSTFRIGDAHIFVEAPVMKDVYFYSDLQLSTRELQTPGLQFGELYVDFENVSGRFGGRERLLNVRLGQINTPFGEEYALRGPMANPLISHSLSDVWGIDGGIEFYGELGAWNYAVALQNGSADLLHDRNDDKAVTARLGWTPVPWLSLSASAMRTGELKAYTVGNATGDVLSNIWFGNGFFRALGPGATTGVFWADLWEGDATVRWKGGHAAAALGGVHYDDSDSANDNSRRLSYGYLEAVQDLTPDLYFAARYSEISAPRGYPLAGWGAMGRYFFAPNLSTDLDRVSFGLGYRLGAPLVLKLEYARERGRLLNGNPRDREDFLGAQAALKF